MRQQVRGLILSLSSCLCWLALATQSGSEQVEPGWAVGSPLMTSSSSVSAAERQELLEGLLRMHVPALLRPAVAQSLFGNADVDPGRQAVRTAEASGWRPASRRLMPLSEPVQPATVASSSRKPELSAVEGLSPSSLPSIELKFRPARIGAPVAAPTEMTDPTTAASDDLAAEDDCSAEGPELTEDESDDHQAPVTPDVADDETPSETLPVETPTIVSPEDRPLPPLTPQLVNLRSRVRSVLSGYYRKSLNSRDHDPWEAMHGMLAYGVHSRIHQGGPRSNLVTSVGWLCYNKPCKGQTLMHVTREGELRAKYGVGLQGHLGQLLAMLAQCRVSSAYPIRVSRREFTIADLIEAEKRTCYPDSELTFKLIAFQYYLDLNETWVSEEGVEWDFPRLVREELAQPIRGAACGGTHRLSGLSLTVKRRLLRGEPLDGEYARAAEFVERYHQYAFRLQNRDGSLSTAWFQGRGDERDIDRRIKTTGHILEWLCYSLSDAELRDQRTIRAVSYLANLMYSNYDHEWEVGPVSHATHALLLYDERVFQPYDSPEYAASYRPKRSAAKRTQRGSSRR